MPSLHTVIILSDGKMPTYKGGPNFGMAIDIREKFDLSGVMLCFGATALMSESKDSAGK